MEVISHLEMKVETLRYILNKNRYIHSHRDRDTYLPSHGSYIPLKTLENGLEVVPHPRTGFGILGVSLKKFGTFNLWVTRTPISLPMVHFIFWGPLGSDYKSFPTLKWTLKP